VAKPVETNLAVAKAETQPAAAKVVAEPVETKLAVAKAAAGKEGFKPVEITKAETKVVATPDVTMLDYKQTISNAISDATKTSYRDRVGLATISWAIYVVFALLFWTLCYPGPPVHVGDIEDPVKMFQEGHFQCLKDPNICLCACFCPGLRWADTMNLAGFLEIGSALTLVFFCALLNGFVNCWCTLGPCTLLLALYYRQKLREQLDIRSWSCASCFADVLYLLCCPWCALAHEARVVTQLLQKGK